MRGTEAVKLYVLDLVNGLAGRILYPKPVQCGLGAYQRPGVLITHVELVLNRVAGAINTLGRRAPGAKVAIALPLPAPYLPLRRLAGAGKKRIFQWQQGHALASVYQYEQP